MKTPTNSKLRAEANVIGERLHVLQTEITESDSSIHVVYSWYRGQTPSDHEIRQALFGMDEQWVFSLEGIERVACRKRSRKYHRTVEILSIDYYFEGTWNKGIFTRALH